MDYRFCIRILALITNVRPTNVSEYYENDSIFPYNDDSKKCKFGFEAKFGILQERVGILKINSEGKTEPNAKKYTVKYYVVDYKGQKKQQEVFNKLSFIDKDILINPTAKIDAVKRSILEVEQSEVGIRRGFSADVIGSLIGPLVH